MMKPPLRGMLVHAGAVGDFVMALRLVAALRAAGARHVTVLGRPAIAALALDGGGADRIEDLETGGFHVLFDETAEPAESVRERLAGHDLVLNAIGSGAAGVFSRRLAEASGGRVIDLDLRPRADWRGHVTEQWLADLAAGGLTVHVGPPRLRPTEALRSQLRRELALAAGPPPVVLHPGSGSREKCWPLERFEQLAVLLRASTRQNPWFLLGPVEDESWPPACLARLAAVGRLVRDRPLTQVAALMTLAAGYVGNDSGVSHLAAATGTPCVAIFGPTDPQRWRPLGEHVRVLHRRGWPSVEEVAAALDAPR